jgi:hypothetical protein
VTKYLHSAENFKVDVWEGCMRIVQCDVGCGYCLSTCCGMQILFVPHREHIRVPLYAPTLCREIIVKVSLSLESTLYKQNSGYLNVTVVVPIVTTVI